MGLSATSDVDVGYIASILGTLKQQYSVVIPKGSLRPALNAAGQADLTHAKNAARQKTLYPTTFYALCLNAASTGEN